MSDTTPAQLTVTVNGKPHVVRNNSHHIILELMEGQACLNRAYRVGIAASPITVSVPVFQEMLTIQKRLGEMMQEVSKIQGLS